MCLTEQKIEELKMIKVGHQGAIRGQKRRWEEESYFWPFLSVSLGTDSDNNQKLGLAGHQEIMQKPNSLSLGHSFQMFIHPIYKAFWDGIHI